MRDMGYNPIYLAFAIITLLLSKLLEGGAKVRHPDSSSREVIKHELNSYHP